jgi:hypothetical protein
VHGAEAVLTERSLTLSPIPIIGNELSVQLCARKGAVKFGTAGVRNRRRSPQLGLRREFISPRYMYTTVWDELLRVQERAGTTMCGRFTQNYTWEEFYAFLNMFGTPRNLRPRYNVRLSCRALREPTPAPIDRSRPQAAVRQEVAEKQ